MSEQFPRKTLPSGAVDVDSLERHVNSTDPHPGVFIKRFGNKLCIDHPTLYKTLAEFRAIPALTEDGYDPRLVFYTGDSGTDETTGLSYQYLHPYIYAGAKKTVSGTDYPVWVDKIEAFAGISEEEMKNLIYIHATDADTTLTNVHPTLARKVHTHAASDITDITSVIDSTCKGKFVFIVHNATELEACKIDQIVITYPNAAPIEWKEGNYIRQGRLYRYDAVNLVWTDITASSDTYSKTEIDAMIIKHNSDTDPFSHSTLAKSVHTHLATDITNLSSAIDERIGSTIDTKISAHNTDPTAHGDTYETKGTAAGLVNTHNTDATAHAGVFASAATLSAHTGNSDIHVTTAEKAKISTMNGVPSKDGIIGKTFFPVFTYDEPTESSVVKYRIQLYPGSTSDETHILILATGDYAQFNGIYNQDDLTKTKTARTYTKNDTSGIKISYADSMWSITGVSGVVPTLATESPVSSTAWKIGSTVIALTSMFGFTEEKYNELINLSAGDTLYTNLSRDVPPTGIRITGDTTTVYNYNESGNVLHEGTYYYNWVSSASVSYYTEDRCPVANDVIYNTSFASAGTVGSTVKSTEEENEYLATAEIESVNVAACAIYLTESLYQDPITSTTQIGYNKSGSSTTTGYYYYTTTDTALPSLQYLVVSGASTNKELFEGKQIFCRVNYGIPQSNTITKIVAGATTSADRVYLGSAITGLSNAGRTFLYLPPTNTYIGLSDSTNENLNLSQGEYQFNMGYRATTIGGWNTITGLCSFAGGVSNIVAGDFTFVEGVSNNVTASNAYVKGNSNVVIDTFSIAVGNSNKLYYQSEIAIGGLNEISGVGSIAIGNSNHITSYDAIAVGSSNVITGKYCYVVGYSNKVASVSSYVFGRYGEVSYSPENKNAVMVFGGSKEDHDMAFAIRTFGSKKNTDFDPHVLGSTFVSGTQYYTRSGTSPNFTYTAVTITASQWKLNTYYYVDDTITKDSQGNDKYIDKVAYRSEYKGQLSAITDSPASTVTAYEIDFERFSRVILPAGISISLVALKDDATELDASGNPTKYIDGDRCEIFIPKTTTVSFPSDWVFGFTYTSGKAYLIEIQVINNVIYAYCKGEFAS